MFDLIKNKYVEERRGVDEERQPITIQVAEGNGKPNIAAISLIIILYTIAISLTVYGAVHLNDCPAQNMIAISLVVLGGLSLVSRILNSPSEFREAFQPDNAVQKSTCVICLNLVIQIIVLCWFFALCYWILSLKADTKPEDHGSSNYCELQFYRSTYWGSIAGLALFGLSFIGSCCIGCYLASRM